MKFETLFSECGMVDAARSQIRMGIRQGQTCRLEIPVKGGLNFATGVLIGVNTVITNWHAVQSHSPEQGKITAAFDYKQRGDGRGIQPRQIQCKTNPTIIHTPPSNAELNNRDLPLPTEDELDFALLQLEEQLGLERGWCVVSEDDAMIKDGDIVKILQHPKDESLQLAENWVRHFNENHTRISYLADTDDGSSGSPCFDKYWNLVALHHAGEKATNRGIPTYLIRRYLERVGSWEWIGNDKTQPSFKEIESLSPEPYLPGSLTKRQADTLIRIISLFNSFPTGIPELEKNDICDSTDHSIRIHPDSLNAVIVSMDSSTTSDMADSVLYCSNSLQTDEIFQYADKFLEKFSSFQTRSFEHGDHHSDFEELVDAFDRELPEFRNWNNRMLESALKQGKGLRILLDFPPELQILPWEKLLQSKGSICDNQHTSVVRQSLTGATAGGLDFQCERILLTKSTALNPLDKRIIDRIQISLSAENIALDVRVLADTNAILDEIQNAILDGQPYSVWHHFGVPPSLPGTRKLRNVGTSSNQYWEDLAVWLKSLPGINLVVPDFPGESWRMFPRLGVADSGRYLFPHPSESIANSGSFFSDLYILLHQGFPLDVGTRMAAASSDGNPHSNRGLITIFSNKSE